MISGRRVKGEIIAGATADTVFRCAAWDPEAILARAQAGDTDAAKQLVYLLARRDWKTLHPEVLDYARERFAKFPETGSLDKAFGLKRRGRDPGRTASRDYRVCEYVAEYRGQGANLDTYQNGAFTLAAAAMKRDGEADLSPERVRTIWYEHAESWGFPVY